MAFCVNRGTTSAWSDSIPIGILGNTKSLAQGGVTQLRKNTKLGGNSHSLLLTKNPYPSLGTALGRMMEP